MTPCIYKLTVLLVRQSCLTLSTKGKRLYFTNNNNIHFVVMYGFFFLIILIIPMDWMYLVSILDTEKNSVLRTGKPCNVQKH